MTRTIEYYFNELELEVELECSFVTESTGIGSYEYWGNKEYQAEETYLALEQAEWNREEYTEQENKDITEAINKEWDEIEKKALHKIEDYFI